MKCLLKYYVRPLCGALNHHRLLHVPLHWDSMRAFFTSSTPRRSPRGVCDICTPCVNMINLFVKQQTHVRVCVQLVHMILCAHSYKTSRYLLNSFRLSLSLSLPTHRHLFMKKGKTDGVKNKDARKEGKMSGWLAGWLAGWVTVLPGAVLSDMCVSDYAT